MVELTLVVSGSGREIKMGEFPSLNAAKKKICDIDAAFEENGLDVPWHEQVKLDTPNTEDILEHWEGCDVYAEDTINSWMYVDGWELQK